MTGYPPKQSLMRRAKASVSSEPGEPDSSSSTRVLPSPAWCAAIRRIAS